MKNIHLIPQEEWKQETLVEKMIPLQLKYNLDNMKQEAIEEAAEKKYPIKGDLEIHFYMVRRLAFIDGAKSNAAKDYWFEKFQKQNENKYSEEEVRQMLWELGDVLFNNNQNGIEEGDPEKYFDGIIEQFKKQRDGDN
jgi:hypothetical protein